MTSRTAWTAGNGVGLTWTTVINSADMASLPTGSSVLSSVADIANGTALDMFMDISAVLAISSTALSAGANLAFWLYELQEDAATYGDGQLTSGTQAAKTPSFSPAATIILPAVTLTALVGFAQQIIIPPGSFRVAMQNNSGVTLSSGTQTVKYRTYNLQLNN